MKKNDKINVSKNFNEKIEELKAKKFALPDAEGQADIDEEINELRYKWIRHCYKQCKKIGEWWESHQSGNEEKKDALLPYWEQYLEEIDEYLLTDEERTQLENWAYIISSYEDVWADDDCALIDFDEE